MKLRWYWVAYDTHIVVEANGRPPRCQGFWYHRQSNTTAIPTDPVVYGTIALLFREAGVWEYRGFTIEETTFDGIMNVISSSVVVLVSLVAPTISIANEVSTGSAIDYYLRGANHYQQGNLTQALEDFTQAIALDPTYAEAYVYRGFISYQQSHFDRAFADLSHAIDLDPRHPTAYVYRGLIRHQHRSESLEALVDLTQAITLAPNRSEAYLVRGDIQADLGHYSGAIADYNRTLQLEGDRFQAYLGLGLARAQIGDLQGSIEAYTQAIQINPNDSIVYFNRGVARAEFQQFQEALADFNKAIELEPNYADAYFNRAAILNNEFQNRERSIEDFQRAARLYRGQGDILKYEHTLEQIRSISEWSEI
ncbi:MAG: tetratricopeptide repeat protein [Cyanobacteria bacterium SID2]|nr:tetratricopeptide repeat protein [Cyanobacteria bacterium SID2]MBP0002142.1 tetratricopeptide repeat protein [Cyanobacteria bacterium SBC]